MITLLGCTFSGPALFIFLMAAVFVFALWREQKANKLNWTDMITRDGTKVSTTKVLQLVGGVVATWIVIQMTLSGHLTWDLFAIYLGYVASIDGFTKLLLAKYGGDSSRRDRGGHSGYGRSGRTGGTEGPESKRDRGGQDESDAGE